MHALYNLQLGYHFHDDLVYLCFYWTHISETISLYFVILNINLVKNHYENSSSTSQCI